MPEAVQSYLYAAWFFDDANNTEKATRCRMNAVEIIDENEAVFKNNDNFQILKADMLRRCGEFKRIIREYEGKKFSKPIFSVIAQFQIKLAKEHDSKVYKSANIPGVETK